MIIHFDNKILILTVNVYQFQISITGLTDY